MTDIENATSQEVVLADDKMLPTLSPLQLVAMAIQNGSSVEQLEKLMALQERHEANEARKAYTVAMNNFKADAPTIVKNKTVAFNDVKYKHAGLNQVSAIIGEALAKHQLSHRWSTEQNGIDIKVTCIITHSLGHSESVSLTGSPDVSGKKNSIQAVGSTVTYLQRYTLLAAAGIAVGDDDDGNGAGHKSDCLAQDELDAILQGIEACKNVDELKTAYMSAIDRANKLKDNDAVAHITRTKNAVGREIQLKEKQ